jgi:hypothetical protein
MPPQDNTGLPWRSKRAATSPFRHIHAIEKAALTPPNRVRGLVLPSLSPSANIALWILCPAFECLTFKPPSKRAPIKYWIGAEFIAKPYTIDLVSVGIVAEDGREFYAESRRAGRRPIHGCGRTRAGFVHLVIRERRQAIADVLAAHAFASTGWATIDC